MSKKKKIIYYLKDQTLKSILGWLQGLNASGYAGFRKGDGIIVDRREFPDAIPVQENKMFGVIKPKELKI